MTTATATPITIKSVDTVPSHDAMQNLSGVSTYTEISLDRRGGEIIVSQEYKTNSTSFAEYHGHIWTWRVPGNPKQENMREFLSNNLNLFEVIVAGYGSKWDGSNTVATSTREAVDANEELERAIEAEFAYQEEQGWAYWEAGEWLDAIDDEITADMTDEQLEAWAKEQEEIARGENVIIDDALEWATDERDRKREEADDEE